MSHAAHGCHARAADPRASPRLRAAGCGERGSHEALAEVPPMPVPAPFGGIPGSGGRTVQRLLGRFLHSALRNLGFRVDEQT